MDWIGHMKYKKGQIIGVTGIMGAGKSYFAQKMLSCEHHIIEIDDIRRELLWSSMNIHAIELRKTIIENFNLKNYDQKFFFDRASFTEYIFSQKYILKNFNCLCKPFFIQEIFQQYDRNKINLLVWSHLIEDDYIQLLNSIIFIDIHLDKWKKINPIHDSLFSSRVDFFHDLMNKKALLNKLSLPVEVLLNE